MTSGAGVKHHNGPCDGKIGYVSQQLARFEAQRLADLSQARMSVYRCPNCKEFHVGTDRKGLILPNTATLPEDIGERERLVERLIGINGAIEELRYGSVDRSLQKRRRLLAEKSAVELRLAQIKRMRREKHHV